MRSLLALIGFILLITLIFPIIILATWNGEIEEKEIKEIKEITDVKNQDIVDSKELTVDIYDKETKKVINMTLEEYIKGVVAGEMPAEFEVEALKSQSVAARTYAISRMIQYKEGHPEHPNAPLCNTIHCQVWYSKDKLLELHSQEWYDKYWGKIEQAVKDTKGEILTYEGKIITEPLFHSSSGGMTEASEEVFSSAKPYLRPVESPYEGESPSIRDNFKISIDKFISKLKEKYPTINITKDNIEDKIDLIEKTSTGRISKIRIDNVVMSGRDLRTLFGFKSTNFTITVIPKDNEIIIQTIGNGHGVGMSQWGANGMAEKGSNYKEILKHYYTGVEILQVTKEMMK
ncbi:stage II sporulation protein D [Clostridium sp. D2Q-11]|uniref:Stage II sporulation protein D n=1 Tax=Anaeromonas frigoriresistens TaxID=2683708 RepID=A0A942UZA4_9FIRM|nr:stage II sporulation protein D [Anaeromonas frigoriresistens]MBS4538317.1 stage II sporulation protein D [Anaeromonas frigoriresistens]